MTRAQNNQNKNQNKKKTDRVIALTGTAGFLGSSLLKVLENDPRTRHVIAFDNRKPPFELKKTKFYRIDLTETLADAKLYEIFQKEKVDTVAHMALPVSPPHDLAWAHELQSIGTMYVLDACAAAKVKKLIMASTTEVYGAHATNPNYLAEDHERRGGYKSRFLRDKIDAENQFLKYAKKHPEAVVTILRPCTILGPTVKNYKTNWLQRPVILTVLGYDPLFQVVHEDDVIRAFKLALDKDFPGIFNVVGDGVIPLSKALKLAGKIGIPVPGILLYPFTQLMWYAGLFPAPSSRLDFLKYLSVADGERIRKVMGFKPSYSTIGALQSFIGAQRLRQVHLLEA